MPEELIKAIYTLTKALERFPKGAAGSRSASDAAELVWKKQDLENIKKQSASCENRAARIEFDTLYTQIQTVINRSNRLYAYDKAREESPGRYANEAAYRRIMEMKNPYASKYADYKDTFGSNTSEIIRKEFEEAFRTAKNAIINPLKNLEKTYSAQFGPDRGKRMVEDLLEIEAKKYTLSLTDPEKYKEAEGKRKWGKQWKDVKAAEEGAATKALADKAKLYTLSLTDPEKYRDVVGREQWGEHWSDVKAAEDASEKERSFGIRGFGVFGKFGGVVGRAIAAVEAFTAGVKTAQNVISSLNEVFIGASRWGLQMKNLADVFNVSPQIAQAYISTGMTSEQANKAAGNMDVWLAGLGFNKGWERIQAMAMAGFDVSAIDWANATPEQVLKTLSPQVKGADHRKLATALALGAFSTEDILMMKDYGKAFKDLDRQEQVAQAKEAWRYKLEKLKISDDPKERAIAAGLEKYGDYGYLETEYGGGREKAYKAWYRDPISLKLMKKISPPDAIWTREEGEERLVQEMLQGMYEQQSQALMEIPDSGSTAIGIRNAQGSGDSNSNTITVNVGGVDVNVNGNVDDEVANNIGDVVADAIIVNFQSSEVIA